MSLPVVLRPGSQSGRRGKRGPPRGAGRQAWGKPFLDRLNELLARIGALPQLYGVVWRNVRAARLRWFTYVVLLPRPRRPVEVLAVIHGSRAAATWQARA